MAMPHCCYLAKGAKRPKHTINTISIFRTCATQIHFRSCATQIYSRTCAITVGKSPLVSTGGAPGTTNGNTEYDQKSPPPMISAV